MITTPEQAQAICEHFHITLTRPNIRRVSRARAILMAGHIRFDGVAGNGDKQFTVRSQTRPEQTHRVHFNGTPDVHCTCEDWERNDRRLVARGVPFCSHICKHGLAVKLWWRDYLENELKKV